MIKNAYIHIPFCRSKCNYCSFVSFDRLELKTAYLKALENQIDAEYKGEKLNTLYFGGGTPSLLSVEEFKRLLGLFSLENNAEITVEVNPDSIDFEYLQELKSLGINRLSIGSQTFDDKVLKLIGRRHNSEQIKSALNCARKAGFDNISLDLIYGLPAQDLKDFEEDLKVAVDLQPEHISLYGLKIEEGCYFHKRQPDGLPDLDMQADMYLKAVEFLKNSGFEHYEISNFARKSYESKHNLNYWNNKTYYGFGCSASGYIFYPSPRPLPQGARVESGFCPSSLQGQFIRYTNQLDLGKYIQNPFKKISEQKLTKQEVLEEAIFLGLRKIAGINIEEINKKFNINFEEKYFEILKKYSDFFTKTEKGYALNLQGILISNDILSEFISD